MEKNKNNKQSQLQLPRIWQENRVIYSPKSNLILVCLCYDLTEFKEALKVHNKEITKFSITYSTDTMEMVMAEIQYKGENTPYKYQIDNDCGNPNLRRFTLLIG